MECRMFSMKEEAGVVIDGGGVMKDKAFPRIG